MWILEDDPDLAPLFLAQTEHIPRHIVPIEKHMPLSSVDQTDDGIKES